MQDQNADRTVQVLHEGAPVATANPLPVTTVGGGGGAVTIADGADVAQGALADAAVTGDSAGTISAKLRGLLKILTAVWDSVNGRLKVDGSAVTQPVSGTVAATQGTSPWVVDQQSTADLDYDTGGGTVNQAVVGLALPGVGGPVAGGTTTDPVVVKARPSATPTRTSVASTTTPGTTILAANAGRLGAMVYNDSNQVLYLAFGSGATSTDFSVRMTAQSITEVPFSYTGVLTGVWNAANGAARVTEFT